MNQATMFKTVILTLLMLSLATADFIFKLQFNSYDNPTHVSYINMGCCDDSNRQPPNCGNRCDTYLHVCVRKRFSTMNVSMQKNAGQCLFGSVLTDRLGDGRNGDEVVFTADGNLDITGNLTNPLMFSSNKTWPGSVQVIIQSFDRDGRNDDYIDTAIVNVDSLDLYSTEFTASRNYIGVFGISRYGLSFQANCADNYYGAECTVFCMPRNDSLGHYNCNQDGSIECLQGYTDPDANCTQCSTSTGCSPTGGYCTQPFECLCHDGFSGENCTMTLSMGTFGGVAGLNVGAIAGGIAAGLSLVVCLGVIIILVIALTCKRKQKVSNTITKSKTQVLRENATYIDLIARDSLTRSTELIISGSDHYQLEPAPATHITKLGRSFELSDSSDYQNPQYAAINSSPTDTNHNATNHNIDTGLSDAESSTSLHKMRCYSSADVFQGTGALDESMSSLDNQSDFQSTTNLVHNGGISMKRNNSYRVLEMEDQNSGKVEGGELVYSYPRLRPTESNPEGTGYTTVATGIDNNDPYSMIELANMYENIAPEEDMTENELYGSLVQTEDQYVAGRIDPYMNEDFGPS